MALHDSSDYLLEVRLPHNRGPSAGSFVPLLIQGLERALIFLVLRWEGTASAANHTHIINVYGRVGFIELFLI